MFVMKMMPNVMAEKMFHLVSRILARYEATILNKQHIMKQLNVDVSPPASIINLIIGRVHGMAFACKLHT